MNKQEIRELIEELKQLLFEMELNDLKLRVKEVMDKRNENLLNQ